MKVICGVEWCRAGGGEENPPKKNRWGDETELDAVREWLAEFLKHTEIKVKQESQSRFHQKKK